MAKSKATAPATIPQEVQEDIIGLAILNRQLQEIGDSIKFKQERITATLTGDAGLVADLVAEHNRRAAKIQRQAGVQ
jgi:hypothetical protein